MNQNKVNLFLKGDEIKFLSLAVVGQLEQVRESSSDPKINWSPESRKVLKEMITAGTSLRIKLEKLGFDMSDLPPLTPGEENDYLTKES